MATDLQAAAPIRPLDKGAVHKIHSGQVVISLAGAVKELVENSLDAGSTVVDVRLKNYGSESIEVTDNGPGVREEDFQALTLKHYTSKIKEFEDLVTIDSFGFRGEALSSLCELSDVTITTRHKDSPIGYRIEYDHGGNLVKKTPCASQVGTTVELRNIFVNLRIRHQEFVKNLKREFGKMLQVLYGYCLISTGVRIMCNHQNANGKKTNVLATRGNDAIKGNVVDIFGAKQLDSLLEFKQHDPNAQVMEDYGISSEAFVSDQFRFEGFVSSCQHGLGRSSSDRQFYYINGRPCDPVKVSKALNEVYHTYNRHQYPMVVLNIILKKDAVDVNVTPDKRQLYVSNEKWLLVVIKSSLLTMYENTPAILDVNNTPKQNSDSDEFSLKQLARTDSPGDSDQEETKPVKKFTPGNFKRRFSLLACGSTQEQSKNVKQPRLDKFFSSPDCRQRSNTKLRSPLKNLTVEKKQFDDQDDENKEGSKPEDGDAMGEEHIEHSVEKVLRGGELVVPNDTHCCAAPTVEDKIFAHSPSSVQCGNDFIGDRTKIVDCSETVEEAAECTAKVSDSDQNDVLDFRIESRENKIVQQDCAIKKCRKVVEVPYKLENHVQKQQLIKSEQQQHRKFRAKFTDSSAAENELKREISKEMFAEMQIIGQFNLGFIIAKLGSDLFIVDQHASDEKYNYETLMKDTVLLNQKLIRPLPLELTAASEGVLIENMHIFEKNGFKFLVDETAVAPKRVMLTSIPLSKSWLFGKEDVEELIFMLSDAQGVMCRPSRIQMMFASRACRKSVMIGTHLNTSEMRKLVRHMGELEQPWNCPHGRPTLRHLLNLKLLLE